MIARAGSALVGSERARHLSAEAADALDWACAELRRTLHGSSAPEFEEALASLTRAQDAIGEMCSTLALAETAIHAYLRHLGVSDTDAPVTTVAPESRSARAVGTPGAGPSRKPGRDTPAAADQGVAADTERYWKPDGLPETIPVEWGAGISNRKGTGIRWHDPLNPRGSGVRIDKGDPDSAWPSQRVDHVIVRYNGKVIGRDGNPIEGSIKVYFENAHIPFSEWSKWSTWHTP
ncbi:hypothetical protein [Rhizohabitans arisaemae]|uniref:hypothetical protein n=1 Tax=Rhizohabitans arisaemae TaxID=2720610 RepID=UPI0024B0CCB5|nr:hypothetical protein [Rhizohabitans arisaemae]